MAFRRAVNLPIRRDHFVSLWIPRFQRSPNIISQRVRFINPSPRTTRTFHTGTPLMVAKLLSVEELFTNRSLQKHLKKIETEYSDCLRELNCSTTGKQCSEDTLRTKRTTVLQLAPLIQSIRELDSKLKEISETEVLLKGKSALLLPHKNKDTFKMVESFFHMLLHQKLTP